MKQRTQRKMDETGRDMCAERPFLYSHPFFSLCAFASAVAFEARMSSVDSGVERV